MQVYWTPNGSKYHRKTCKVIQGRQDLICGEVEEAKALGKSACGICFKSGRRRKRKYSSYRRNYSRYTSYTSHSQKPNPSLQSVQSATNQSVEKKNEARKPGKQEKKPSTYVKKKYKSSTVIDADVKLVSSEEVREKEKKKVARIESIKTFLAVIWCFAPFIGVLILILHDFVIPRLKTYESRNFSVSCSVQPVVSGHVGHDWMCGEIAVKVNGESVKGDTVELSEGDSVTVSGEVIESDSVPDVGQAKITAEITQDELKKPFYLEVTNIKVKEKGGRYSGSVAYVNCEFHFSPEDKK